MIRNGEISISFDERLDQNRNYPIVRQDAEVILGEAETRKSGDAPRMFLA